MLLGPGDLRPLDRASNAAAARGTRDGGEAVLPLAVVELEVAVPEELFVLERDEVGVGRMRAETPLVPRLTDHRFGPARLVGVGNLGELEQPVGEIGTLGERGEGEPRLGRIRRRCDVELRDRVAADLLVTARLEEHGDCGCPRRRPHLEPGLAESARPGRSLP